MKIKGIVQEDFCNYNQPSMLINFPRCSFKCEKELGKALCQNSALVNSPDIEIKSETLVEKYLNNRITSAIVCAGLEPFDSYEDLKELISVIRSKCLDNIVIYTGYNKAEILSQIAELQHFPNIIIKYGRYIPDQKSHFDSILGIYLASDNQYAEKIS